MRNLQFGLTVLLSAISLTSLGAMADPAGPKTAQEFAAQYMAAFNAKDKTTLGKLRYPTTVKSPMQEVIDQMTDAELDSGMQYQKFELLPLEDEKIKPQMGLDGQFYEPNLKPTTILKLTAQNKDGSSSTSFPIGQKDGIFYQVAVVPAQGQQPVFNFGWQRFTPPKSNWSVSMPNEPEPGKAALELESGKKALEDPDAYGVVRNTASIKTCQHFFQCGSEGKRIMADDNQEKFRAACTTYEPEALKTWFSDPQKTLDDTVDLRQRSLPGKLLKVEKIDFHGSPGRQFEIRGDNDTYSLGRVYWIKDALYELTYESTAKEPNLTAANKFVGSLEVNP